ncbi:N-acyl-phosphatidylethanolamine-hydrolyzing phospholipase D-like [Brevipalpus obovatus]|uniref:N-acyl-phosphatidylethanolamine-hydrolyzing phospholipase D-like n=1 Tax=Brevipalpus obovatus TaxID=246614 RepID=UPI003D9E5B26
MMNTMMTKTCVTFFLISVCSFVYIPGHLTTGVRVPRSNFPNFFSSSDDEHSESIESSAVFQHPQDYDDSSSDDDLLTGLPRELLASGSGDQLRTSTSPFRTSSKDDASFDDKVKMRSFNPSKSISDTIRRIDSASVNVFTSDSHNSLHSELETLKNRSLRRIKRNVDDDLTDIKSTCSPGSIRPAIGKLQMSVYKDGRFHNPWPTWSEEAFRFMNILKLGMTKDNSSVPNAEELDRILPVSKPNFDQPSPDEGVRVTWIGHSTLVVQLDGFTVLTDPLFSMRASPSTLFGPKRYRPPACTIADLPESLDAVVISHNHYDHLDSASVVNIHKRYGNRIKWFVPLNLRKWFNDLGIENVQELDWWEEYCTEKGVKVVFTPAQHWSKRGIYDDFTSLWGSWTFIGPKNRFFFTGDTGYCPVFKEIGQVYGPFTAAAIPIGAYAPRWFMSAQHVDPYQAVQIHQDLRSQSSMAIHWGTFALAFEYFMEPPVLLRQTLSEKNIPLSEFVAFKHGESQVLPLKLNSDQNSNKMDISTS